MPNQIDKTTHPASSTRVSSKDISMALAERKKRTKEGKHLGFAKFVINLMAKGYSKKKAEAVAASVGRKTYGTKGFAALSMAAKRGMK